MVILTAQKVHSRSGPIRQTQLGPSKTIRWGHYLWWQSTTLTYEPPSPLPVGLVVADDTSEPSQPFVSPSEFYRRYVRARKPVIFRGLAKSLCVYELWRNETWLAENRGYIPFDIDIRKRHGSEIQAKQIMTLSTFLEVSHTLRDVWHFCPCSFVSKFPHVLFSEVLRASVSID